MKLFDKSKIHKILVVSLTNIGDVILTFPVIDILKRDFPFAELSVVIGPKAESLLTGNPVFHQTHIFDKHQSPIKSLEWVRALRRDRFDLVVDLRHTAIPMMIAARFRTPMRRIDQRAGSDHMRFKHLRRLRFVYDYGEGAAERRAVFISQSDRIYVAECLKKAGGSQARYVVVAPGAADESKRWPPEFFAELSDRLARELGVLIVVAGSREDQDVSRQVTHLMKSPALDLCGQTSLVQLAELFRHSCLAVVNDSAPMHLASYLDVPVMAVFGPTDPGKYGPWSRYSGFLRKNEFCAACQKVRAGIYHTCMRAVTCDDVMARVKALDLP